MYAFAALQSSCLENYNGQIRLGRSHTYYYQVQMQIFLEDAVKVFVV